MRRTVRRCGGAARRGHCLPMAARLDRYSWHSLLILSRRTPQPQPRPRLSRFQDSSVTGWFSPVGEQFGLSGVRPSLRIYLPLYLYTRWLTWTQQLRVHLPDILVSRLNQWFWTDLAFEVLGVTSGQPRAYHALPGLPISRLMDKIRLTKKSEIKANHLKSLKHT